MAGNRILRGWGPALGVLTVGLIAFGVTLQGAPTESTDVTPLIKGQTNEPGNEAITPDKPAAKAPAAFGGRGGGGAQFTTAPVATSGRDATVREVWGRTSGIRAAARGTRGDGTGDIGDACTCDSDCMLVPTTCVDGPDKGDACTAGSCAEGAVCEPTPCRSLECIEGVCTVDDLPFGVDCDTDGNFCTDERCDGNGICEQDDDGQECQQECVGGTNEGENCTADADCGESTCELQAGVVCNEDLDRCEIQNAGGEVIGRCCESDGTCSVVTEAACADLAPPGFWLLVEDPDDLNECLCPKYSSGIAPHDDGVDQVGPVVQSHKVCEIGLNPCQDDTFCQRRCATGGDAGTICQDDADCSGTCEDDPCVVDPDRCDGLRRIGDDYSISNGSYYRLTQFRFRGGVRDGREAILFEFYDNSSPPKFVGTLFYRPFESGILDHQIIVDCYPNCDVVEEEDEADEPFIIPGAGHVVMRSTRADFDPGPFAEPPQRATAFWMSTSGVQVGANNAGSMWVDDGTTNDPNVDNLAGADILIFELYGEKLGDPTGACCNNDTGACGDVPEWECRTCTTPTGIPGAACERFPDCGFEQDCEPLSWFGPLTKNDFPTCASCQLCDDGPCASGACCDEDGTCSIEEGPTACAAGATWRGFGSSCDPNCCEVAFTGADLCENTIAHHIRVLPNPGAGGECVCPGGACVGAGGGSDGDACFVGIGGAPCAGGLCAGGANNGDACLTIPDCPDGTCVLTECRNAPVTVTITGDSSGATIGTPTDPCTISSVDLGWYETVVVNKAAQITFDHCCSTLQRPTFWINIYDNCQCDAGDLAIGPDVNDAGFLKVNEDANVTCLDGQASSTYTVRPGTYTWQVFSPPTCFGTFTVCESDDNCLAGVQCTSWAGPYQMHITVEPAPLAACCLGDVCLPAIDQFLCETDGYCGGPANCVDGANPGLACTNDGACPGGTCGAGPDVCGENDDGHIGPHDGEACDDDTDCTEGQWLGELSGGVAIADCTVDPKTQLGPCDEGACCFENPPLLGNVCEDTFSGQPAVPGDCDGAGIDYVGGVTCADNPCPVCTQPNANCQEEFLRFILRSDLADIPPTRRADDFRPNTDTLKQLCFSPGFPGNGLDCARQPPSDHFFAHIYEDDFGLPGLEVLPDGVTTDGQELDITVKEWWGGNFFLWDYRAEFPIEYSPATNGALVATECYWMQLAGTGEGLRGDCGVYLLESDAGNGYSMLDTDTQGWGPEDIQLWNGLDAEDERANPGDIQFCIDASLQPGALGCGQIFGPCILCGEPVACENRTVEDCQANEGRFMAGYASCEAALDDFPHLTTRPSNDDCANALPICVGAENCSIFADTICASPDGEINTCFPYYGRTDTHPGGTLLPDFWWFDNDVWYEYTPPDSGLLTIGTCSQQTLFDTVIAIYGGDSTTCVCPSATLVCVNAGALNGATCTTDTECGNAGYCLPDNVKMLPAVPPSTESLPACADDNLGTEDNPDLECFEDGLNGRSIMEFQVAAGNCYKIRVGGFRGAITQADGQFELQLSLEVAQLNPPVAAPSPHNTEKNRYVAFNPNNGAAAVGFEITLPTAVQGGTKYYLSVPVLLTDTNGVDPQWVSSVVTTPVVRSWEEQSVVFVRGCVILPDETYEIRTFIPGELSPPLVLSTVPNPAIGSWADIVGDFVGGAWTGPNSNTNFKDVAAGIQGFQQLPTAAPVSWVDLVDTGLAEEPNYKINFNDIGAIIRGFLNVPYPGTVADCVIPDP